MQNNLSLKDSLFLNSSQNSIYSSAWIFQDHPNVQKFKTRSWFDKAFGIDKVLEYCLVLLLECSLVCI